jgi:hypothetical protein
LQLRRQLGDKSGLSHALLTAGDLARRRGNADDALDHYREGLLLGRELGNRFVVARGLDGLAGIHVTAVAWEDAVRGIVERAGLLPRPELAA